MLKFFPPALYKNELDVEFIKLVYVLTGALYIILLWLPWGIWVKATDYVSERNDIYVCGLFLLVIIFEILNELGILDWVDIPTPSPFYCLTLFIYFSNTFWWAPFILILFKV